MIAFLTIILVLYAFISIAITCTVHQCGSPSHIGNLFFLYNISDATYNNMSNKVDMNSLIANTGM